MNKIKIKLSKMHGLTFREPLIEFFNKHYKLKIPKKTKWSDLIEILSNHPKLSEKDINYFVEYTTKKDIFRSFRIYQTKFTLIAICKINKWKVNKNQDITLIIEDMALNPKILFKKIIIYDEWFNQAIGLIDKNFFVSTDDEPELYDVFLERWFMKKLNSKGK